MPEFPTLTSPDTEQQTALPTDARNKQKEQQKVDKEAGNKPRGIPKLVEDGSDDCGEDLRGLGRGAYYTDVPLDTDGDDDGETFELPAGLPADAHADVFPKTQPCATGDRT
eukprot:2454864-Pyramimonas_sp.AAC.1